MSWERGHCRGLWARHQKGAGFKQLTSIQLQSLYLKSHMCTNVFPLKIDRERGSMLVHTNTHQDSEQDSDMPCSKINIAHFLVKINIFDLIRYFLLVSQDRVSPTGWLKSMEIYSFPVLQARGWKSRCQQNTLPLRRLLTSFLASELGAATLESWHSLACDVIPLVFASVVIGFPLSMSGSSCSYLFNKDSNDNELVPALITSFQFD